MARILFLSSPAPSPPIVSLRSVRLSSAMWRDVRRVIARKIFPFDQQTTLSAEESERVEARDDRREATEVPLPTPERPTTVTTRPAGDEEEELMLSMMIPATSPGVFPSTLMTVYETVDLSSGERTPEAREEVIPAESMVPSSASRV